MAASRFGLPLAAAPARAPREAKTASVDWSEPEPWIIAVLLVTGVVVLGRHPIARAIGTEADDTALTPSVVATAPPATTQVAPAPAAVAAPVPTHEPRNPFHALVKASGAIIAPEGILGAPSTTQTVTHRAPKPVASKPSTSAASSATCAGTMHTVVAGDTLWTLAAKIVGTNDTGKITATWHRIYKANTPPLANPSLLPVGTKLCLPNG